MEDNANIDDWCPGDTIGIARRYPIAEPHRIVFSPPFDWSIASFFLKFAVIVIGLSSAMIFSKYGLFAYVSYMLLCSAICVVSVACFFSSTIIFDHEGSNILDKRFPFFRKIIPFENVLRVRVIRRTTDSSVVFFVVLQIDGHDEDLFVTETYSMDLAKSWKRIIELSIS